MRTQIALVPAGGGWVGTGRGSRMKIDSPDNPRVKEWKKLATRKGREETGLFLIEGPHLLEEAAKAGLTAECVLVEIGRESSPNLRLPNGPQALISERVAKALGDTVKNQGLMAIIPIPHYDNVVATSGRYLLLDNVQDPGNVGTMIRTAAAAGLTAVVLGANSADAWSPKTVRATQGAIFRIPVVERRLEDWIPALREKGVACWAAAGDGDRDYRTLKAEENFALVIGNEGAGVRPEVRRLCDGAVRIPLAAGAESLSAPVAAGILLFQMTAPA